LGLVTLFGFIAGVPSMILAGPVLSRFVAARVPGRFVASEPAQLDSVSDAPPPLMTVLGLLLLPIILIVGNTVCGAWLGSEDAAPGPGLNFLRFVGHPFVALLITTLCCSWWLGSRRGMSKQGLQSLANAALEPAGIIILVTGAGGVLKQVLVESRVGNVLADQLTALGVTPLLLAFLLAWVVRVMQGSATVAMLTAAGLMVPIADALGLTSTHRALQVIAIAAGATCCSHVNDSGFWLVNRYLGLSTSETLRSWTLMTAVVGLTGLAVVLLIGAVLGP
jgi:Gnt-I system low-affinity gluconate transporter